MNVSAQGVSINEDGTDPHETAILDIQSSSQGVLIPRMTSAEIKAIAYPADGLQVYNSEDGKLYIYVITTGTWKEVSYGTGSLAPDWECGDLLYDYRDDRYYETVGIGTQCWMAENLNVGEFTTSGHYNDGIIKKSCNYANESNCDTYGGLYSWDEMMDWTTTESGQGICPIGWHVPSDSEWFQMENTLDPVVNNPNQTSWRGSTIGGQLKEPGYDHWNYPNSGANNSSGMTFLGAGWKSTTSYGGLKVFTVFLSSTPSSPGSDYIWGREFDYNKQQSYRVTFYKYGHCSVRCVKD